jgi:hypothetical protein
MFIEPQGAPHDHKNKVARLPTVIEPQGARHDHKTRFHGLLAFPTCGTTIWAGCMCTLIWCARSVLIWTRNPRWTGGLGRAWLILLATTVTTYPISILSSPISILSSYGDLSYPYCQLRVISMSILSSCRLVDRMTISYVVTLFATSSR